MHATALPAGSTRSNARLGRLRIVVIPLALAGLLTVQAGPASAANTNGPTVSTVRGGWAHTYAVSDTYRHLLTVTSRVFQDPGGPQTIGARISLYLPSGAWYGFPWRDVNTQDWSHQIGQDTYFTHGSWAGLPPGNYFVRAWYRWYTMWGWYDTKGPIDVGWIRV